MELDLFPDAPWSLCNLGGHWAVLGMDLEVLSHLKWPDMDSTPGPKQHWILRFFSLDYWTSWRRIARKRIQTPWATLASKTQQSNTSIKLKKFSTWWKKCNNKVSTFKIKSSSAWCHPLLQSLPMLGPVSGMFGSFEEKSTLDKYLIFILALSC